MDPLSLLRDFTIRKQLHTVILSGDVCKFGDEYKFPADVPTAFKARTNYGDKGHYTLEMVVRYIKSINLKHTEYMASVPRKQHVAFVDRKDLKEYLEGVIDSSDAIDIVAPLPSTAVGQRRKAEDDGVDDVSMPGGKRARGSEARAEDKGEGEGTAAGKEVPPPVELTDEEKVKMGERPVRSAIDIMCCPKVDAFKHVLGMWKRREEERKQMEKEQVRGGIRTDDSWHRNGRTKYIIPLNACNL